MADQKISELTALTGANLADVDAFAVVDTSAVQTKKITYAELKTALDTGTGFVRITGDAMTGNLSFGDNNKAIFGAGSDLQIYHDGSHSYISDTGTGYLRILASDYLQLMSSTSEVYLNAGANGEVTLYYDNLPKLATTSTGINVTGTVTSDGLSLGDFTDALTIGDSNDLSLYHASGSATIKNDTGDLTVRSDSFRVKNNANNEEMFSAYADGAVTLYYNSESKLNTQATGINVTGTVTATGQIISAGGAISAPTYSFTGDTDTGISRPTSNAVNIVTAGVERLRIASAGEIQIGGTSNAGFVDFDGTALQLNTQRNPNTGTFVNTSKSHAGIALVGGDADSHIKFYTKDSNNAVGTERVRIDKEGRVAIGHSSSNALLQVSSGSGVAAGSQANPALQIGATTGYRLGMYTDAEGGYIENKNGDDGIIFKVKTAGEAMRIDGGTGKVGIGTASPEHDLHVKTAGQTEDGIIKIGGTDGTLGLEISYDQSSVTTARIISNPTYTNTDALMHIAVDGDANPNHLVLNGSGNVGIGTASFAHKLSIQTNANVHLGYNGTSGNTETGRISSNSYAVNNESYSLAEMNFVTSSANGYTGGIQFRTNSVNSTNTRAAIRWSIDSNGNTNQTGGDSLYSGGGNWDFKHTIGGQNIVFSTTTGGGSTGEVLRITNDGKLTLADNKVLQMSSSSTSAAFMQMTDTGSTTYEMLFPSSSSIQLKTHTTSDRTLSLYNSGAGAFDLEVNGTGKFDYTTSSTNTMLSVLKVQASSSGTAVANHGGAIQFLGQRNDGAAQTLAQVGAIASTNSGSSIAGDLVFHTGSGGAPSEKMRLDDGGKLGVGTQDPQEEIHVMTGASSSIRASGQSNNNRKVEIGYDTADGPYLRGGSSGIVTLKFFIDNTVLAAKIADNADFYTNDGTVHSLSDIRVKTDVEDLVDGLDIVKQLKPRTFKYTADSEFYTESKKDEISYGFVANEVEKVAPQYTDTGKGKIGNKEVDDLKSLSTTKMIPMLVKAIQEQQEVIESLTARITTLEG